MRIPRTINDNIPSLVNISQVFITREAARDNFQKTNKRLREIVNYKTRGKHKEFAELVVWKPQYLAKLLHGSDFGLKPVSAVLKALPKINARWLLRGEGQMLTDGNMGDLYRGTLNHIQAVLDLELLKKTLGAYRLGQL